MATATTTQTAQAGAQSIYEQIARTAETVADGIRWQTLDWHNQPHYAVPVATGVAGITLFLADYHRLTGEPRALDLALGGLRWCVSPAQPAVPDEAWNQHGLIHGRTGLGMAWLRLAAATGDRQMLAQAEVFGDELVGKEPGPVTDWQDGAAGEGVFLLRLAEASGQARFLEGAVHRGAWLDAVAIRDEHGCYWPWEVGDTAYATWHGLSFIPGLSGIGHFLLSLDQATQETRWADLAREAGKTLRRQAVPDQGGLNWPDTLDGVAKGEDLRCQWCYGASGVGLFFAKAHETLVANRMEGHARSETAAIAESTGYLAAATAAGETTYAYGDVRRNPCQCHGLAGNAELFLELYRVTRDSRWLSRTHDFAKLAFAYRQTTPEGAVWQSDDPGYHSADFLFGAAGTGHFFLRLWQPDALTRPLL